MVQTVNVAQILGGSAIFGKDITSLFSLSETVSAGLPKQALRKTAQRVFDAPKDVNQLMYRLVPEATFKRRTRLTPAESERTERLARVIATAEFVWDGQAEARLWLTRPHPELSGRTPLEHSFTELGARQVEDLLQQLFYGLPA